MLPPWSLGVERLPARESVLLAGPLSAGATGGRGLGGRAAGRPPTNPGLDEGVGAGTLDAEVRAGAPVGLTGFEAECGACWRRAVEVFIVFFEGLEALSFTSTRRVLRDCNVSTDLLGSSSVGGSMPRGIPS